MKNVNGYSVIQVFISLIWFKISRWMIMPDNFGSATVPVTPPLDASRIPKTLLALFRNNTLNCSTKSILFSSQVCFKRSATSLDVFI